ncbi:MAG: hypothetical protein IPK14_07230 [Blastocatellia bacterium]|nr:hypothetical protein [Blastocatellia bacterium]MBL8192265.1 hypothetical protein [Blastocatellia bacterium]MBN8722924.1 hypothetical protein [Acidobacteriota bacterium]
MNRKVLIALVAFVMGVAALFYLYPRYFGDKKVRILVTHYDYRPGYLELAGIAENIGKEPVKYNPQLYVKVFDEKKNLITESKVSLMPKQEDNPDLTAQTFGEFDCLIKVPSGYGYVDWELSLDGLPYQVEQKNKSLAE